MPQEQFRQAINRFKKDEKKFEEIRHGTLENENDQLWKNNYNELYESNGYLKEEYENLFNQYRSLQEANNELKTNLEDQIQKYNEISIIYEGEMQDLKSLILYRTKINNEDQLNLYENNIRIYKDKIGLYENEIKLLLGKINFLEKTNSEILEIYKKK